jgi:hydrogenase nickel incorporation protein HypA/HybF
MHELSLCGSIAGIASRCAAGRPVDTIHLQIGRSRDVVLDRLVYCWTLVTTSTELEGSRLDVEIVAGEDFLVTSLDVAKA